jgi:lipopolysaccharide transport system ATP-binding protein
MPNSITIKNLSKRYRIGSKETRPDTMLGTITNIIKSPLNNFKKIAKLSSFKEKDNDNIIWALKNISLDLKEGGLYGIIGANGAGKSTLLKILSRITWPSDGVIHINGKIASLLEVGTGFHQDLTGRENIYLNGTYLGMTKKEVDEKFEDIVSFANVTKFIDTPVKRFSTGMRMRLAFAVAAFLDSDILLIDEVLAVGDASFQKKCLQKMDDLATTRGRTILFVSHQIPALQSLCKFGILLDKGQLIFQGTISEAIGIHLKNQKESTNNLNSFKKHDTITINNFEATLNNEKVFITYDYSLKTFTNNLHIGFVLIDMKGNKIINSFDVETFYDREPGNYTSAYSFNSAYLLPGDYIIKSIILFKEVEWYERENVGITISIPYHNRTSIYNSGILRRIGDWNISIKNK